MWPFAQTLEISALITSMIAADPFVAIRCLSQINTLRLDVDMKLQSGKVTSSCHHSTTSLMELRSGKLVGHKHVAPPVFKFIQGPFGRIKMLKRRAEGGGTEWVCETCKPGVRWGRCRIGSCTDRGIGPVNRRGFSERRRNERDARQEEEERRRFCGSSDDERK